MLTVTPQLPDPVNAVRAVGHRHGQIGHFHPKTAALLFTQEVPSNSE
jgi:hypothetical protein